jgi:pimeloyl-ACP methyl ester carboxylesterase
MVKSETLECCPEALCELMYDHTHQDWRSECRHMTIPALVLAGRETKIFPIDGIKAVAEMIPDSELKIFENCGHWLYLEEPKKFADEVHDFVTRCDDKQRAATSEGS